MNTSFPIRSNFVYQGPGTDRTTLGQIAGKPSPAPDYRTN